MWHLYDLNWGVTNFAKGILMGAIQGLFQAQYDVLRANGIFYPPCYLG